MVGVKFFSKRVDVANSDYRKTGLETNISNYGWYKCVQLRQELS